MRRLLAAVCALACAAGVSVVVPMTQADAAKAHAGAPHRVRHAKVTGESSTSVTISWSNPKSRTFASTVVRVSRGTTAPKNSHAGRRVATVGKHRHGLTVRSLKPGVRYTFALFASDGHGHLAPRATLAATTGPSSVTSLRSFAESSSTLLSWTNPRRFDHLVARFAKGVIAPASPSKGHGMRLGPRATSVHLAGLVKDTTYSVSVWAVDAHRRTSTPTIARFTTAASATLNGRLDGRVVDRAGHPLLGAEITTLDQDLDTASTATTGIDGRFSIAAPAGVQDIGVGGDHISGGNSDTSGYQPTFASARVTAGHSTALTDIVLDPGAALTGRVTDVAGHPLAGVDVYPVSVSPYVQTTSDSFAVSYGSDPNPTQTAADGTYTLKGLGPQAVRLCVDTVGDVTGGSSDAVGYTATCGRHTVVVPIGTTKSMPDLPLASSAGGTVRGTVHNTSSRGLRAYVTLTRVGSDHSGDAFVETDAVGHFVASHIAAGTYSVCVQAVETRGSSTGYAPGCAGSTVAVRNGASSTSDVTMHVGAAVTGKITGRNGAPVVGAFVLASGIWNSNSNSAGAAITDSYGHYTIRGLKSGAHGACVDTSSATVRGIPTGVLPGCFGGRGHFSVSTGDTRSGIDVVLATGGAVAGRITDTAGRPQSGAYVDVESDADDDFDGSGAVTDASGRYTATGLPAGRYSVCVEAVTPSGAGESTCRRGTVTVKTAVVTKNANIAVVPPSTIEVTVQDSTGAPVAGVDATALASCQENEDDDCDALPLFGTAGVTVASSTVTDADGRASLDGLTAGHYAVCLSAYYGTTASGGSATGYADTCTPTSFGVAVTTGRTTRLTLTLAPGGAVSGVVTDAAGAPVGNVAVLVSNSAATDYDDSFGDLPDGFDTSFAPGPAGDWYTAPDGSYSIIGVTPGARTVCFDTTLSTGGSSAGGYRQQCHGASADSTTRGTPVAVTANSTTAVNQTLTAAGGISGTVHVPAGHPAQYVDVIVFQGRSVTAGVTNATVDDHGRFAARQLAPGSYTVCFLGDELIGQCYKNVAWPDQDTNPPLSKATLVTALAGVLTPGVDATLRAG